MNYFTFKEIDDMIKANRIIIIRKDYVYDVTNFSDHPGGLECLHRRVGLDTNYDYKFHSKKTKKLWSRYLIGKIKKENSFCIIM